MSQPLRTTTQDNYLGNRYQILSPLGQGGMGAVHCARDRLTGQLVALKRVRLRAAGGGDHTIDELASTPQHGLTSGRRSSTQMALGVPAVPSTRSRRGSSRHPTITGSTPAGSPEQIAVMQLALAREFGMLASLRHPNIIRDVAPETHDPHPSTPALRRRTPTPKRAVRKVVGTPAYVLSFFSWLSLSSLGAACGLCGLPGGFC